MLNKPLAKVKFEYFREKLGFHQIKIPSKGSDESKGLSDMVVVLAPPMVRCKC